MESLRSRARARVGTCIQQRWTLRRLLGVGGIAAVYEATDRDGTRRALKIVHESLLDDDRVFQRLEREAALVRQLSHPAIVPIHEICRDDDASLFLVMDLLEGHSVDCVRRNLGGALPGRYVRWIATELLHVVAAAHGQGVLHRDIKPSNLFLTRDGSLKVLDFGIARSKTGVLSGVGSLRTIEGTVLGTPTFMSPEQARGRWGEVDERSDIWSLGATLFTLASGRPVHEALNTTEALGLAMTAQARPLGDLTPKLDKDLSALVDRALRFKPGDRWPNAKAMFTALTGQEFVPGRYPCSSAELVQLLDALGEEPSAPDEDVSLKTTVGRTRHGRERVESKAKQCSLPPRPTSVLPRGVDVGRVALLRTRYWELYEIASAQILVLRRTSEPLESTMDLRRENVKVVSCLDEKHRGWGGVVDMRKAPPPRNDLGFEDAMQFLRQRLSAQLSRLSVLVSSAAGLLQVSRIDRVDGISTHVTQSEEDALRYAAG